MDTSNTLPNDKLMEDLQAAIANAENALQGSAADGEAHAQELRNRLEQHIRQAKEDFGRLQEAAMGKAKSAGAATNAFVRENPWQSAGIAAGIGLILGLLISRR